MTINQKVLNFYTDFLGESETKCINSDISKETKRLFCITSCFCRIFGCQ